MVKLFNPKKLLKLLLSLTFMLPPNVVTEFNPLKLMIASSSYKVIAFPMTVRFGVFGNEINWGLFTK